MVDYNTYFPPQVSKRGFYQDELGITDLRFNPLDVSMKCF